MQHNAPQPSVKSSQFEIKRSQA